MNIHTLETNYYFSGEQYSMLVNDLKRGNNSQYYFQYRNKPDLFTGLSHYGITVRITKRRIPTAFTFEGGYGTVFCCVYEINPRRVFEPDNYISLYDTAEMRYAVTEINELLYSVSQHLPKIEDCILSRIDFTANVVLRSGKQVRDAISIINRSFTRSDYKLKTLRKWNRPTYIPEEATFTKPDYVQISIYDKNHQLNQNRGYNENIPELFPPTLRCEIRCFRKYISALRRKFGIDNISDFLDNSTSISEYVFRHQFKKLNLDTDYVRLPEAYAAVAQTKWKNKTKMIVSACMHEAAEHKRLCVIHDKPMLNKVIARMRSIGLSPMPLPHKSSLPSDFNLLSLVMQASADPD